MKILQHSVLYTAFFFGASLPFSTKISNLALILIYVAIAVLFFAKKTTLQKQNLKLIIYSVALLFFLCVLSFLTSGDIDTILKTIGRRITFLLTPLIFLLLPHNEVNNVKQYALRGLLFGSILSAIYLLVNNFTFYYSTRPFLPIDNELLNFYHTGFYYTEDFDIHPSYLAMYYLLGLTFLLFDTPMKIKWLKATCLLILTSSLIFLSSRLVLLILVIILLFYYYRFLARIIKAKVQVVLSYIVSVASIFAIVFFILSSTYLFQNLTEEALWDLSYNAGEKYNSKTIGDSRAARWVVAKDLILEKPFFGHGLGVEKNLLTEKYKENGLYIAATNRYDAHNQYLSYTIESGIIGLLAFLLFLGLNIITSLKSKDMISFYFFFSLICISLVENFFTNNAGITFIAFFSTIFLFSNYIPSIKKST